MVNQIIICFFVVDIHCGLKKNTCLQTIAATKSLPVSLVSIPMVPVLFYRPTEYFFLSICRSFLLDSSKNRLLSVAWRVKVFISSQLPSNGNFKARLLNTSACTTSHIFCLHVKNFTVCLSAVTASPLSLPPSSSINKHDLDGNSPSAELFLSNFSCSGSLNSGWHEAKPKV